MHITSPVLTVKGSALTFHLYMLNIGDLLPVFGGSSSGLFVRKSASIVTRSISNASGVTDTEWEINDPRPWAAVANLINSGKCTVTAGAP